VKVIRHQIWSTAVSALLREMWATIVPERDGRHGPLPPLMIALTVVTGCVDAISYLALGHVFVANMTGNVVFIAFALAGAPGFSLVASLVAVAAFVLGALAGGALAHRGPSHRGRLLLVATAVEAALVVAGFLLVAFVGADHSRYLLIVLLGLGMGLQNAVARALAVPDLTTTVLTLTITGIAADSTVAGGRGSKAGRRILSALAMFLGGLLGAVAILHGWPAAPLLLAAVVLVAVAAVAFASSRGESAWSKPV
jgi:uncharacterized membrane protein YoaK (UPF0700 family)